MEWLVEEISRLHPDSEISATDFFLVVPVEELLQLRDGKIQSLGTNSTLEPIARFFARNSSLEGIEGVVLTWEFSFNTTFLAAKLKEELVAKRINVSLNTRVMSMEHQGAQHGWELRVVTGDAKELKVKCDAVVSCAGCWGKNFDLQAGIIRKWNVSIREMILIELPKVEETNDNHYDNYFRTNIPMVYYLDQTSSTSDRIAIIPDPISRRAKLYAGVNEGYVEEWGGATPIPWEAPSSSSISLPLPLGKKQRLTESILPVLKANSWQRPLSPDEAQEAEKQLQKGRDAFPGLLGGAKVIGICYGTTVIADSKDSMSRSLPPVETDGKGYFSVILPKAIYAVTQGREVANIVAEHYRTRAKL